MLLKSLRSNALVVAFSVLATNAALVGCSGSSEALEDEAQAGGVTVGTSSGTTTPAQPSSSSSGGTTQDTPKPTVVEPGDLPNATQVPVTFTKLTTLSEVKGGDMVGSWLVDSARVLLPSGVAILLRIDKSGGTAKAAAAAGSNKLKLVATVDVTITGILGGPQKVVQNVDAVGEYTANGKDLDVTWSGTGIEMLPKKLEFDVSADKGKLRWKEDLLGFGEAVIEVDLHRVR